MTTKIIVIIGVSVAAVVGMYFLGRCADKGDTDDKGTSAAEKGNAGGKEA